MNRAASTNGSSLDEKFQAIGKNRQQEDSCFDVLQE